jgi:16S rRNA (guanine(1405)-N(7))-methyltransferase
VICSGQAMIDNPDDLLDQLVANIQSNKKYASILPAFIRRIGKIELEKRRNLKEAIKETKSKLHQVTGAYIGEKAEYASWLILLSDSGKSHDPETLKDTCKHILYQHASTRERLSYIDDFYQAIFCKVPPVTSVLDLACGLNPLSIPWMGLDKRCQYHAWDVNTGMVDFLNEASNFLKIDLSVRSVDLLSVIDFHETNLVFLLKTLPCLEQVQKGISVTLLKRITARNIIVSFPSKSLSGLSKGMDHHYGDLMQKWLAGLSWSSQVIKFPDEIVYVLSKM